MPKWAGGNSQTAEERGKSHLLVAVAGEGGGGNSKWVVGWRTHKFTYFQMSLVVFKGTVQHCSRRRPVCSWTRAHHQPQLLDSTGKGQGPLPQSGFDAPAAINPLTNRGDITHRPKERGLGGCTQSPKLIDMAKATSCSKNCS